MAKKKYYPPTNYKAVTIYLTPEQHEKIKKLAASEGDQLSKKNKRPIRISMADYLRSLIDNL